MIQNTVQGVVLQVGSKRTDLPVQVELAYDEENDPLAVQMIFRTEGEDEVCWIVGRELMARGVTSLAPYGEGDIKFRYEGAHVNGVMVCLNTPEAHADLRLRQSQVVRFLERTMEAIPLGKEDIQEAVDRELDDLLKEGDQT